jgi:lipid-A-disaccharide synthase-like uncharacterized protein
MIDLQHAVSGFLHDVFVTQFDGWVVLGFVAQAMFTGRFLVQWIESERQGRSVIPIAFWLFSIAGGLLLFAYALYRRDPVFIVGQGFGVFVYARNLWLVLRERKQTAKTGEAKTGAAKISVAKTKRAGVKRVDAKRVSGQKSAARS